MYETSEEKRIIEFIETKFEEFKILNEPHLDDTSITMDVKPEMIVFYIMNASNICIYGSIQPGNINIENITHCGGNNISLLLKFIRMLSIDFKASIMITDVSAFYFENIDNKQSGFIELEKLYKLSEGKTYYDKYLNPDEPSNDYPTTPISFFDKNRKTFTDLEYSKIEYIIRRFNIKTIGEFFMKIRELLKSISSNGIDHNGFSAKLVNNNNWRDLLLYIQIIDKTFQKFSFLKGGKTKKKTKRKKRSK